MKHDTTVSKLVNQVEILEEKLQKLEGRCADIEDELLEEKIQDVPCFNVFLEDADLDANSFRWAN